MIKGLERKISEPGSNSARDSYIYIFFLQKMPLGKYDLNSRINWTLKPWLGYLSCKLSGDTS